MKKPFKSIPKGCGSIEIYGNGHWKNLDYQVPEWNKDDADPNLETCFKYNGITYFLGEFMPIKEDSPFYLLDKNQEKFFDAYLSDSFFSGILIKFDKSLESIKAYTYIS